MRTLIEAEIAAREASNTINRRRAAGFPVEKSLEEFDVAVVTDGESYRMRQARTKGTTPATTS